MKKVKLIIAAIAMLSLVSSSAVYADGFAPGEGMYIGVFAASTMGMVQPKVMTGNTEALGGNRKGGTFEAKEGGLGLEGIAGGGYFGYGYKMGDLYAGFEGEYSGGGAEFELTSSVPLTGIGTSPRDGATGISKITAEKQWTGGAFGRLGYYVNKDTLLSLRGGVLVSEFDVAFGDIKETYTGGGPSFGASLSSRVTAIDPNLSVRIGAVYTDFLTAPVTGIGTLVSNGAGSTGTVGAVDSEVTGSELSARIGIQYSFFDVNSLF